MPHRRFATELEQVLVKALRDRLDAVVDHDTPVVDGITREEYLDGLTVHIAAKKGLRVPLEVIGLEGPPA